MKQFLRNIKGSRFWERMLAVVMMLAVTATLLPANLEFAWSAGNSDLLGESTTIGLQSVNLGASYKTEDGKTVTVELNQNDTFELPYDSDITMRLDFMLQDGNSVDGSTVYTYKLPDSVRVDVDATHDLSWQGGVPIGKVHIKKDGTLDFEFDEAVLNNKTNIPFYVQFDGNFSSDKQKEGEKIDITFPASDGGFTFHIETLPASKEEEEVTSKDIGIGKSGNVITAADGKRYIEWNINILPNGRDSIDGNIVDELPAGLTYVEGNGYPKIAEGNNYGQVAASTNGNTVTFNLSGTGSNPINVKFLTSYDVAAFGSEVNRSEQIGNSVVFNPDNTVDKSVTADGSVWIYPNMVSKSASSNKLTQYDDVKGQYYIDWTVTLNTEQLNIAGGQYRDTMGAGLIAPNASEIQVSPAIGSLSMTSDGFQITFPSGSPIKDTVTVTYRTYVENNSLPQGQFTNKADFTAPGYEDFSQTATVNGVDYLKKTIGYTDYDRITKTFRWTITVNQEKAKLNNVVVTDTFNSAEMEYVSSTVPLAASSNAAGGSLVFELGNLNGETRVIQVVTRIKPGFTWGSAGWDNWHNFVNNVKLTADDIPEFNSSASYNVDKSWEVPDFIHKDGTMNGDGTISWTVRVDRVSDDVEGMHFTDILPADMEYVDGSFYLREYWWDGNQGYRNPVLGKDASGKQTLSYDLNIAKDAAYMNNKDGYAICYKTRVTDPDTAMASGTFTNQAKMVLDFPGNIQVEDETTKTVSGRPGGVVEKTFTYQTGREVVWHVKVNEARMDLNIDEPVLEDKLADYFDYVSGKLYLIAEDGTRSEVAKNEYQVTAINGNLKVMLPEITNQCYEFEFITSFNPMYANALYGKIINNTITLSGKGKQWQDTSGTIQNVEYSSSSAGAVLNLEIRIKKVDEDDKSKVLPGATFQLKLGNTVVGEATSGSDGYAVFKNLSVDNYGYTFDLVEVTAPNGYKKEAGLDSITFQENGLTADSNGVRYMEVVIGNESVNKETTGSVSVVKTDVADTAKKLSGAVFGIYKDSSCTDLVQTMTTGQNGVAEYAGLKPGIYYIKENLSPEGYIADSSVKITATLTQNGSKVDTVYTGIATFDSQNRPIVTNTKITASLTIRKTDTGDNPLSGAVIGLYTDAICDNLVERKTTTGSGTVTFTDLKPGNTYYYREDEAPAGYVRDTQIYEIQMGDGTERENIVKNGTIQNRNALGNLIVTKYGDDGKLLEGVVFNLSGRSDTGVNMNQNASTGPDGIARFENVPFGTYTLHETSGLNQYAVAGDKQVIINKLGDTDVSVVNQLKRATIRIIKTDANGGAPLANAQFGLYSSNGLLVKDGWTNASGILEFKDIVYGDYYVKEITAPAGYKLNSSQWTIAHGDFTTAVTNDPLNPLISWSPTNEKQNGKILFKKEDMSGNGLAGAEFTLYDDLNQPYATAVSMTAAEAVASGIAGAVEGSVYFENLPYGTYYIQETQPPNTYLRDTGYYKVVISSDALTTDYYTGDTLTSGVFKNAKMNPPWVSFKMKKTDENGKPLPGATFGFYGNGTQIATAVTGDDGIAYFRRIGISALGDDTVFTVKEIAAPAGYVIDNTLTVTINGKDNMHDFSDETDPDNQLSDAQIPWIRNRNQTASTFQNEGITGAIVVTKHGMTDLESLAGAEFTLYDADGNKVTRDAKGNAITNPAVTGKNGTVRFDNLPYGAYIIHETKPPMGHALNQNPIHVNITTQGQVVQTAMRDSRLNVMVSKQAVGGALEIEGARLQVKKTDGTVIDTWTTGAEAHRVTYSRLEAGQTYILTELTAPNGYTYASDVQFRIEETGSITLLSPNGEVHAQTVVMRDAPFAFSVSKKDADDVNGDELQNAILALYNEDNEELERWTTDAYAHAIDCSKLVAPKSGYNYYILKELSAPFGYEIAGNYIVALDSAGNFYHVNALHAVPTGADRIPDAVVTILDKKKAAGMFYIRKVDTGTNISLPGAQFEIQNFNMVTGKPTGSLISYAGLPLTGEMWKWTSTDVPHQIDAGYLVVDNPNFVYALVEANPPAGYNVAEPVAFRVVTDPVLNILKIEYVSGDENMINSSRDTFRVADAGLSLTIRKQNEFGLCLSGAKLKLSEYNTATNAIGREIITFVSDNKPRVIDPKQLKPNQSYILQEIEVPEGYGKAEDIIFTIHQDTSITMGDIEVGGNTIIMEDYSSGVIINKLTEDMEFLPGATVELSAEDDPAFVTKQWVTGAESKVWDMFYFKPGCTYTLTETVAPDGYAYAEDIRFKISADGTAIIVDGKQQDTRILNMMDRKLELNINKLDSVDGIPVTGATLEIQDTNGNIVAGPWITGPDQQIDISRLAAGNGYRKDADTNPDALREYVLHESLAPESHKYAPDVRFAIDRDGTIYYVRTGLGGRNVYEEAKDHTVVMYDDPKLVVDKQDENGMQVAGASFMITSSEDSAFEPIMINTTPYYIQTGTLQPNVTYTLTEVAAPKGYAYAESYDFTIDEAECVWIGGRKADNKLFMVDASIQVRISKQDITNKQELPGAKLEIRDETGTVIYEFVSGEEPTLIPSDVFTAPQPGSYRKYTLTEITAPKGYRKAEVITFALDSAGKVYTVLNDGYGNDVYTELDDNTVTMLDEPIEVRISKQDITTSKELPGATLVIQDEAGNEIYRFVSGNQPTLIPVEVFTVPDQPGSFSYYSLTEITAPDGYEIAETIYFAIDSEGKLYIRDANGNYVLQEGHTVVMKDRPAAAGPKTGDRMPVRLFLLLGLVSLLAGCILLKQSLFKKK